MEDCAKPTLAAKMDIIFRPIELVAILVTAGFLIQQTFVMQDTLLSLRDEVRVAVSVEVKDAIQEVNFAIVDNPDLTEALRLSQQEILGFTLLNSLEKAFLLHKLGLIEEEHYRSFTELADYYSRHKIVRDLWNKPRAHAGFHPDFRAYIDRQIKKSKIE